MKDSDSIILYVIVIIVLAITTIGLISFYYAKPEQTECKAIHDPSNMQIITGFTCVKGE